MIHFFAGSVTPSGKAVQINPANTATVNADSSIVVTLTVDGRLVGTITL